MSDTRETATAHGQCLCGRHRLRARARPLLVSWCHCRDCRRATGAPVTVFAGFARDDVEVAAPAPAAFRSSEHVERWFCARCGTSLAYVDHRLPDQLYLLAGILDNAADLVPQRHAWTAEQLPWVHCDDGLPRFEGFSVQRPDTD